ncbi:membrane protein [Mycobacterium mantenii]|uniref:Membrane protein n=1 Tax=Mycobacterium mantenii TaxID=560555 RepID=A0A1X0FW96_MYCNT|nr:GAP family protein [Mycobacterium mantenii]MCV7241749.1 GAP family protein [Mycobacterium mantenii]ORB05986.1 hypothetical protein BST30_12100 [Mycobacterium mantenii]BBY39869.1 membrane protein [Mycobacterium mantenii]
MWGTVLALALWLSIDPTRPVIVMVMMSRPRPRHNLVAYWLGGVAAGIAPGLGGVVLLLTLRDSLAVVEHARSTVARFTGGYLQIVIGVLALLIAAAVSAGFPGRRQAGMLPYGGASVLQPIAPAPSERIVARVKHALRGGNPWVAFGIGLVSTMPPADYLVVLIVIASSGAAIGTQFGAVVTFTLVVLTLIEIPLVSYLVMPARTQAAVLQLQRIVLPHRRRILTVVPAVAGILLVTAGVGSI